jgi:hypothetical protein
MGHLVHTLAVEMMGLPAVVLQPCRHRTKNAIARGDNAFGICCETDLLDKSSPDPLCCGTYSASFSDPKMYRCKNSGDEIHSASEHGSRVDRPR